MLVQQKAFGERVLRIQYPRGKSHYAGISGDARYDGCFAADFGLLQYIASELGADDAFVNEAFPGFQLSLLEQKRGLCGSSRTARRAVDDLGKRHHQILNVGVRRFCRTGKLHVSNSVYERKGRVLHGNLLVYVFSDGTCDSDEIDRSRSR